MIFRRVKAHIEKENWFAVFIDFLIVVLGILLAFQITNWSDTQKASKNEQAIMTRLELDFASHEEKLLERMQRSKRLWSECWELLELVRIGDIPNAEHNVENLILGCLSTSFGLAPPASYTELLAAGALSDLTDESLRKVLVEYGQVNALWQNVNGSAEAQESEHSSFRQAFKLKKFNLDSPQQPSEFITYDWELMKQADTSISTILRMHFSQFNRHKEDLKAVKNVLTELRAE